MGQIVLPGNPEIAVHLRRSARARRVSLRLSALDGRVTLTLPQNLPERQAVSFLHEQEGWLRGQIAKQGEIRVIAPGVVLPLEGEEVTVVSGTGRQVRLEGDNLVVPGAPDQMGARLRGWLRERARQELADASDHYAQLLGRSYARITMRDTRSRWGSCTADGGLMYSWRLILAPPEVLDYVAAHEVAHLAEMNHSPAFWRVVTDLYGDWAPERSWLRNHGSSLHRYRFGD